MSLSIGTSRTTTTIRLNVTGEIDMSTVAELSQAITGAVDAEPEAVLIDLYAVTFCDCSGVTALLVGHRAAASRHIGYQVMNVNGSPLRVLRALGLHTLLTTGTADVGGWVH